MVPCRVAGSASKAKAFALRRAPRYGRSLRSIGSLSPPLPPSHLHDAFRRPRTPRSLINPTPTTRANVCSTSRSVLTSVQARAVPPLPLSWDMQPSPSNMPAAHASCSRRCSLSTRLIAPCPQSSVPNQRGRSPRLSVALGLGCRAPAGRGPLREYLAAASVVRHVRLAHNVLGLFLPPD